MERMTELTHLVETERARNRASLTTPGLKRLDRAVSVVIGLIILAGGLVAMGVVSRGMWELVRSGWRLLG